MAGLKNLKNLKNRAKNAFFGAAAKGAQAFYEVAAGADKRKGFDAAAEAATLKGQIVADKLNAHKTPIAPTKPKA